MLILGKISGKTGKLFGIEGNKERNKGKQG
jgi:hypothetical protein